MWWKISKELRSDKTSEFGSKVMHSHRAATEQRHQILEKDGSQEIESRHDVLQSEPHGHK
jgi:hypothetical protein